MLDAIVLSLYCCLNIFHTSWNRKWHEEVGIEDDDDGIGGANIHHSK